VKEILFVLAFCGLMFGVGVAINEGHDHKVKHDKWAGACEYQGGFVYYDKCIRDGQVIGQFK
jgi:hypothetical protein